MRKGIIYILLRIIDINKIFKKSLQKKMFAKAGHSIAIGYDCDFIYKNIYLGSNIHIGSNASFMSSISRIYIHDYVTIGPNVSIRGGDHRIDLVGYHIYEVDESMKLDSNDKDVVVEEGVWIGCNVTILKGVTVGRGSVVAAGSVVTKDVPPYSIVAGCPAKVIKHRFTAKEIQLHEIELKKNGKTRYVK